MSEGTIIAFKSEGGLRISKDNTSITTGKVVVNGIEITSVEDWTKVTQSIVELQQEKQQLKDRINKAIEYIENHSLYDEEYDYNYEEEMYLSGIDDEVAKKDLLSLLKGDKK